MCSLLTDVGGKKEIQENVWSSHNQSNNYSKARRSASEMLLEAA